MGASSKRKPWFASRSMRLRCDLVGSHQNQLNFFSMISNPAVASTISPSAISVP